MILLILAGLANGTMDFLQFHYYGNNTFWNPKLSWRNKYTSKLPFSTTVLVFLTDGWHAMQFICFSALFAFMVLPIEITFISGVVLKFAVYKCIFTASKQVCLWLLKL